MVKSSPCIQRKSKALPNRFFIPSRQIICGLRIMPAVKKPSPISQPGGGFCCGLRPRFSVKRPAERDNAGGPMMAVGTHLEDEIQPPF
jgi:hypothetical protein